MAGIRQTLEQIDGNLQTTLMAVGLYRLQGRLIGAKLGEAKARTLFRKVVVASARIGIIPDRIAVRIGRSAYDSLLVPAGIADDAARIPWLNNLPPKITFH